MEIPATILEVLKCSSCNEYLSRGPVYLQAEAAVCGRCDLSEHPAARDKYYEATAKLLRFPCRYRDLGCPETVPFVYEQEVIAHEELCDHREFVCPVLVSAHCDWLGTRAAMLSHCRDVHQDQVLENPCTLTHDISRSSLNNYLVRAFQLLFLLHTEVSVATGKILHSVRFLGTSDESKNFFYKLNIKRKNLQLTTEGQVVPVGCLSVQEATNINSLFGDDTTYTVTVMATCARCEAAVTVPGYRDAGGWQCERCAPARRACKNLGCKHKDIDSAGNTRGSSVSNASSATYATRPWE